MKILVACEFSGRVRDAFIAKGHEAVSCDIIPSDLPGPHYQGDVREILNDGWDMMIAHPPCTNLTNAGVRWLHSDPSRWDRLEQDAWFFKDLLEAPINKIAVENPVMHKYAKEIIGRNYDQKIQPWMFGHTETKGTCLWLKNLPLLTETHNVKAEMKLLAQKDQAKIHYAAPGPDRWKLRSLTYQGIADAMAEQWI